MASPSVLGSAESGYRVHATFIAGLRDNANVIIFFLIHILSINSKEANKQKLIHHFV